MMKYPTSAAAVATQPIRTARLGRACVHPKTKGSTSQGAERRLTSPSQGICEMLPKYWSVDPKAAPTRTAMRYAIEHILTLLVRMLFKCPRQDSNLRTRFRKPLLYPLSYGSVIGLSTHSPRLYQSQHNLSTKSRNFYPVVPNCYPPFKHAKTTPAESRSCSVESGGRRHIQTLRGRWVTMSTHPVKVTISRPVEFPDRKLPYVVRWRLNGRGHWRSFATKRGTNGADTFYARLRVAAINERDWEMESGVPTSMSAPTGMNVAEYCRSFIEGDWQRLSSPTRKSYVEALASFIVNCRRRGAPRAPSRSAAILVSWLTPRPKKLLDDGTVEWVWNGEPLPRNIQSWIDKNSPLLMDLSREVLYETYRWMRLRPGGVTSYAPTTQNRLVAVAKLALSVAVKRGLIENVPWPRREGGATAKSDRKATIDVLDDLVPSIDQLLAIFDAIPSHQPRSYLRQTMSAICGLAG